MMRFWFVGLCLAACRSEANRTTVQAGQSSTDVPTASSTAPGSSATSTEAVSSAALVTAALTNARQVMDTSLNAPNFQCAPTVVTLKDTLTLRAEVPHGGWLAVAAP